MRNETVRRCPECGKDLDALGKYATAIYCNTLCARRAYYARHRERILSEAHRWRRYTPLSPEEKRKVAMHQRVRYALSKGVLTREPCLFCDDPKVHAHHHDYDQPLAVTWLCPKHHRRVHESLERIAAQR